MDFFTARPEARASLSEETRARLARSLTPAPEEHEDHVEALLRKRSLAGTVKGLAVSSGFLPDSERYAPPETSAGDGSAAAEPTARPKHVAKPLVTSGIRPNARRETYELLVHAASDELVRAHGYMPHRWSYKIFESLHYTFGIVAIVILNVIVMGFESADGVSSNRDHETASAAFQTSGSAANGTSVAGIPPSTVDRDRTHARDDYFALEVIFFCVYLSDLLLRLHAYERRSLFLCEGDYANNWLDCFLLLLQLTDIWSAGESADQAPIFIGMAKMARLLRLTKLKCSPSFTNTFVILVQSLVEAAFMYLLLGILVVACATSVMVYQETYGGFPDHIYGMHTNDIPNLFSTYPDAVLTFMQFTFTDSTFDRIRPLARVSPFLGFVALFYVLVGSIMIMNLLVGLVTDIAFRQQKSQRLKQALRRAVELANYLIIHYGEVDHELNQHVHNAAKLRNTKQHHARTKGHRSDFHKQIRKAGYTHGELSRMNLSVQQEQEVGDQEEGDQHSHPGRTRNGQDAAPAGGRRPGEGEAVESEGVVFEDEVSLEGVLTPEVEGSSARSRSGDSGTEEAEEKLRARLKSDRNFAKQSAKKKIMVSGDVFDVDAGDEHGGADGDMAADVNKQVDKTRGLTIPISIFYDPSVQRKMRANGGVSNDQLPGIIIAAVSATAQAAATPEGVELKSVTAMAFAEAVYLRETELSRDDVMQTVQEQKGQRSLSMWQIQMTTMMLDLQRLSLYAVGALHHLYRHDPSVGHLAGGSTSSGKQAGTAAAGTAASASSASAGGQRTTESRAAKKDRYKTTKDGAEDEPTSWDFQDDYHTRHATEVTELISNLAAARSGPREGGLAELQKLARDSLIRTFSRERKVPRKVPSSQMAELNSEDDGSPAGTSELRRRSRRRTTDAALIEELRRLEKQKERIEQTSYKRHVMAMCGGKLGHATKIEATTTSDTAGVGGQERLVLESLPDDDEQKEAMIIGVLDRISKFYEICAENAFLPGEQAKFHSDVHTLVAAIIEGSMYHPPGNKDLVNDLQHEVQKTLLLEQDKNCMRVDATVLRSRLNKTL